MSIIYEPVSRRCTINKHVTIYNHQTMTDIQQRLPNVIPFYCDLSMRLVFFRRTHNLKSRRFHARTRTATWPTCNECHKVYTTSIGFIGAVNVRRALRIEHYQRLKKGNIRVRDVRDLYSAFRVIILVYVWIDLYGLDEVVSKHLYDDVPLIMIDVMRCLPETVLFRVL